MGNEQINNSEQSPEAANEVEQSLLAMGLGSTDEPTMDGVEDDISFVEKKSRVPGGIVLILIVVGVAVAALYVMRLSGKIEKQKDAEVTSAILKVEQALAMLSKDQKQIVLASNPTQDKVLTDAASVVEIFSKDPTVKQVGVDQLGKNPFAMRVVNKQPAKMVTANINMMDLRKRQRQQQLKNELKNLELQTVMSGNTPMAVVSGKVVSKGDRVGSFRVVTIKNMAVILTADGTQYQLKMTQNQMATHP